MKFDVLCWTKNVEKTCLKELTQYRTVKPGFFLLCFFLKKKKDFGQIFLARGKVFFDYYQSLVWIQAGYMCVRSWFPYYVKLQSTNLRQTFSTPSFISVRKQWTIISLVLSSHLHASETNTRIDLSRPRTWAINYNTWL